MSRKRTIGTRAALGGLTAAVALMTAQPAARADELSDLRANQDLLQRRIDQLAQAQVPGNLYGVGGPPGPVNVQMTGGSFPRSFLIPGTDTSIRVGGEIRLNSLFWVTGGNPNQNPPSTNAGTTGQVNNIPLKGTVARLRGDKVLNISPQQSKLSVETRTPTAYGEARSFLEFDFAGGVSGGARILHASDNLIPRLRYAYGTLGPLLFGQANSNFNDADAGLETLDFGGLIGGSGPARIPQIRWTQPLGNWGLLGALSVSAEASETEIWAPGVAGNSGVFGANGDSAGIPGVGNVLKNTAPSIVAAWYIPQPWGHVDFAGVVRPLLTVEHPFGAGVDKQYTGYAFNFSGDVKPRWFGWNNDYFVWGFVVGEAAGMYHYAGSNSSAGLVSNITAATLTSNSVNVKPTRGWAGRIGYRHEWAPGWRSNIGVGHWHLDIPRPGSGLVAGNTGGMNTDLTMGVANLIWAPTAFVDIGMEYVYGRRKTVNGANGDQHVIINRMRLRF
ncbi:MAG: DcaP family trimeric outer membrane transporter [Alphaproteobacteria bacterium]